MAYTKLFQKILASSIWNEDVYTKVVWITMLAMKDEHQIVQASIGGLAHQARVPIEKCRDAIAKLEGPDPDDSSGVREGRRIEPLEHGGWLIINGQPYRDAKDEDERRAYMTAYMREYRKKQAERKQNVNNCKQPLTDVNSSKPPLTGVSSVNTAEQNRALTEQNKTEQRTEHIPNPPHFVTRDMVYDHCENKHWNKSVAQFCWGKLMGGRFYGTPVNNRQDFAAAMEVLSDEWEKANR